MTQPPLDPLIGAYIQAHQNSDVDSDVDSYHHTLGPGPEQAAPGSHLHIVTNKVLTEESTTAGIPVDLTTPGPTIVLPVTKSGKIIVWASAEVRAPSMSSYPNFIEPELNLDVTGKNIGTYFTAFEHYLSTGVVWHTLLSMWILDALIEGNTTIKLMYGNAMGSNQLNYRNRYIAGTVCR